MPAWQVYLKMEYDSKLATLVEDGYTAHLAKRARKAKIPDTRLVFQNRLARKLYKKETPEMKAAVQKRREEGEPDAIPEYLQAVMDQLSAEDLARFIKNDRVQQ